MISVRIKNFKENLKCPEKTYLNPVTLSSLIPKGLCFNAVIYLIVLEISAFIYVLSQHYESNIRFHYYTISWKGHAVSNSTWKANWWTIFHTWSVQNPILTVNYRYSSSMIKKTQWLPTVALWHGLWWRLLLCYGHWVQWGSSECCLPKNSVGCGGRNLTPQMTYRSGLNAS